MCAVFLYEYLCYRTYASIKRMHTKRIAIRKLMESVSNVVHVCRVLRIEFKLRIKNVSYEFHIWARGNWAAVSRCCNEPVFGEIHFGYHICSYMLNLCTCFRIFPLDRTAIIPRRTGFFSFIASEIFIISEQMLD